MLNHTLADLREHQSVRITAVNPGRVCQNQLADLGFLPGTLVSRVGQAPFGDPVVYSIRGTRFALRRHDAQQIAVETIEQGGTPVQVSR